MQPKRSKTVILKNF